MQVSVTQPKENYFDAHEALKEAYKFYRSNQSLSPDETAWPSGRIFLTTVNTFAFPVPSAALRSFESLVFIIPIISKTADYELEEPCSIKSSPEIENFCKDHGLERALKTYKNVVCRIFKNASKIIFSLSEDPEIENYIKVCLNIKIKADVQSLIQIDREFFKVIDSLIPEKERDFFVKTFEIIE